MLTVSIVCVGNIKDKFFADACNEYIKRLGAFCKLNIIEIKEQNALGDPKVVISREGEDILKVLEGEVILLDRKGKELDSPQFAKFIETEMTRTSKLTFVIGGSYGVSDEVKKRANYLLSFSPLTFPHNLFRVMLLEQIYRGFTIINNKTYHK